MGEEDNGIIKYKLNIPTPTNFDSFTFALVREKY